MKTFHLFAVLVSLPLLLGGCGEDPVAEVKPVEEKQQEVKEDVKPEEPLAETKPKPEGVNYDELDRRGKYPDNLVYLKGSDTPYTGKAFVLWENGQKTEVNFKDGNQDGLQVVWHKNGQKGGEVNFKNGKPDGQRTEWYENGEKRSEGKYKDGNQDGLQVVWHKNGQKSSQLNYKDGKRDGLQLFWHQNEQKKGESNFKDGEVISEKWWNSKGEPVDTWKETFAE